MKTIIRYTDALEKAQEEIRTYRGQITQICTSHVFVANFPDDFDPEMLQYSRQDAPINGDDQSKLVMEAWKAQEDGNTASEITTWDDKRYHPPKNAFNDKILGMEERQNNFATSRYMKGHIAVGVVLVSGPAGLSMSGQEKVKILSQLLSGLNKLASYEPTAGVVFEYKIMDVHVEAAGCPEGCKDCGYHAGDVTAGEVFWRDAVLKEMGYSSGLAGIDQLNRALIVQMRAQWAYSAFFTKYPQCWFAYAGSGRICMTYGCDGWGPDQIGKVFAHETCHIFGAADEYASSGCTCQGSGQLNIPNYNCDNCHANVRKTDCLMKNNDFSTLCAWTRGQLGWPYAEFGRVIRTMHWKRYYKSLLPFEENGKIYLLGHSDEQNRWFISELSRDWDGQSEIKNGHWGRFYECLLTFKENGKTYLFGHSSKAHRWFISELSTDWDGQSEIRSGSWGRFYKTLIPFTENGKTYLLGQSSTGNRWFISELTTAWNGQSEVRGGSWARYYEVLLPFTENGKMFLFGHSSTENRWFISDLSSSWDGQSEISGGNWVRFYPSILKFENNGVIFIFGQSVTDKRWFISRLSANWNGHSEVIYGNWGRFFGSVFYYKEGDLDYLMGHSETDNKSFIVELFSGAGI